MPRQQKNIRSKQLDEIIQFRISTKDKEELMKVAALSGLKHTTYARQQLMRNVRHDLEALDSNRFILNDEGWNQFVEILESPSKIPPKLKAAKAKYKKKYTK